MAGGSSRIKLDLNSPEFLDVFLRLQSSELKQAVRALQRLRDVDWETLYRHVGFQWETIRHIPAPRGVTACSLRLSEKMRAIAYREGDFLRIISLHPDHDSAYRRY